jgi:hypothetical protein
MQNKPDEAFEAFEQMLEDRGLDEYCRILSAQVLTAAAHRHGPEALLQMLERVAQFAADEAESVVFREHMAGLLLDFPGHAVGGEGR